MLSSCLCTGHLQVGSQLAFGKTAGQRWMSSRSSAEIRTRFLDFFRDRDHAIVASLPVVPPMNEKSLAFVNAGMNAWKRNILGDPRAPPLPAPMVANTQKCMRVNDIDLVGLDGHHHTFFEMLGSWAFDGAYFKRQACLLAWEFLTGPAMSLPRDKLFVTYFKGCGQLEPDLETREIWREIGVKESNILGFGPEDNLWEMGAVGPCGPSTEIHFDHNGRDPEGVNKGYDDLVEVWNLVFMELERGLDGGLKKLNSRHVDTGMGLERLVAVANGRTSNYDSDLFMPIFSALAQRTGCPPYSGSFGSQSHLDRSYRVVADHTRAISACICDGMFPDSHHRLRQLIKRTLTELRSILGSNGSPSALLLELCEENSRILGDTFPELEANFGRLEIILPHEEYLLNHQQRSAASAEQRLKALLPDLDIDPLTSHLFEEGFKFLKRHEDQSINVGDARWRLDGPVAFKLYESVGLKAEDIKKLTEAMGIEFEVKDFREAFERAKKTSKLATALAQSKGQDRVSSHAVSASPEEGPAEKADVEPHEVPATKDDLKYDYKRNSGNHYVFPAAEAKVLAFVNQESPHRFHRNRVNHSQRCAIILDRTTFYSESGGQVGDRGSLVGPHGSTFTVEDCQLTEDGLHVAHVGFVSKGFFVVGNKVKVRLDTTHRIQCMQNHTATHLLNLVLHRTLPLTCQKSSLVDSEALRFDFSVYGQIGDSSTQSFNTNLVAEIEGQVNELIASNAPVSREVVDVQRIDNFLEDSPKRPDEVLTLITVPNEVYPDTVSLISVPGGGVEPCCGTHVLNTGDVQAFVIVNCKTPTAGVRSLKCVTGLKAMDARDNGLKLLEQVSSIAKQMGSAEANTEGLDASRRETLLKQVAKVKRSLDGEREVIPYVVKVELNDILSELSRHLKTTDRSSLKLRMEAELEQVLQERKQDGYVVHHFETVTSSSNKLNLSKLTKMCPEKPILLLCRDETGQVSARAVVPKGLVHADEGTGAMQWLECVAESNFLSPELNLSDSISITAPRGQDPDQVVNMKAVKLSDNSLKTEEILHMARLTASEYARKHFSAP